MCNSSISCLAKTICILVAIISPKLILAADLYVPSVYSTIQAGINAATSSDTVVVADGIYTGTGNKNLDFNGKLITVRSSGNDPELCIIDCQNNGQGFIFENSENNSSILSGFTIKNGNSGNSDGGGIYCFSASPTIVNCIIKDCVTNDSGGGIYCVYSSPAILDCIVTGNSASTTYGAGGGICCEWGSSAIIKNCIINDNMSGFLAGGIHCHEDSNPTIINCTISGNTSGSGGGICGRHDDPVITNCIIWENTPDEIFISIAGTPIVTYSNIKQSSGTYPGTGNINAEPLFVTGTSGGYYLSQTAAGQSANSPCVDSGNNQAQNICFNTIEGTVCMNDLTTRTDSITDNTTVDMGYHYLPTSSASPTPTFTPSPSPPTNTPIPPTNTPYPTNTPPPTSTPPPPTNTPTNTPTIQPGDPTNTPIPPTNTPHPTNTPSPTSTPPPPTHTPTHTPTVPPGEPTNTPIPPTKTPIPTSTPENPELGCTV
ncbi:right-handed parallel beta-helix repeat-containing protein, partial [bacterium]|nr:right-handed parallel beta-helix repeat-containing protein [bacterium]